MRIHCAVPLGISLLLAPVLASPAVKVGLKASWNSAPFLLELLETAAEEDPSSYWPLIDKIAEGTFSTLPSDDKSLYTEFLRVANDAGFLTRPEERSSFDLALSIHSASPRIEAHYHHYANNLEPGMGIFYTPGCAVWTQWASKQFCEMAADWNDMEDGNAGRFPNDRKKLAIDRILETKEDIPAGILYADILAPEFKDHHIRLKKYAESGKLSYRLRYKPPLKREDRPVMLSGYGVELVLKKTDYMVIDDRDVEGEKAVEGQQPLGQLDDAEVQDIKPLSKAELAGLGHKAATFVMGSEKPFETLLRLVQDFPKHAAAVAAVEAVDENVVEEVMKNWDFSIGPGKNVVWINGVQIEPSQVNAFALLDYLRMERKYIDGFKALGLNSSEAISLFSHPTIGEAKAKEKVQRFDYRDDTEGGEVLVWLNNLEKDSRYQDWSSSLQVLLRRVFPGQLHPLRRNLHTLVYPFDFSDRKDLEFMQENMLMFIQRRIAIRFALVPLLKTKEAVDHTKVVYHLYETYGLKSVLRYVEVLLEKEAYAKPTEDVFKAVLAKSKLKEDKTALSLSEVLSSENLDKRVESARSYGARLGMNAEVPPILLNGQPVPKNDEWTSALGSKLPQDVALIQNYVYILAAEDTIDNDDIDLGAVLLEGAAMRRNSYIFPETDDAVKLINIAELQDTSKSVIEKLPQVEPQGSDVAADTSVWVVGDFDESDGYELLESAVQLQKETPGIGLVLVNNPQVLTEKPTVSTMLYHLQNAHALAPEVLEQILREVKPEPNVDPVMPSFEALAEGLANLPKKEGWSIPDHLAAGNFWREAQSLLKAAEIAAGQRGIIINGRVVGPIAKEDKFTTEDFKTLVEFEHERRIKALVTAAADLGLSEKITGGSLAWAAITNQVALSAISETPPGVLEEPDTSRINVIKKFELGQEHSVLSAGDFHAATIQIVSSINPASEMAQKWVPLLHILSEMNGVALKLFLNPAKIISELPVKRFYRHVLNATPVFDEAGKTIDPSARFENLPEKPLLSFSIDVAPSWLVNPVDSVYDLDNLMLESLKDRLRGSDVTAIYELTSILIEGHARDVTTGLAPRGVQVILGTQKDPQFADTIVMANLNYFQFKANPGVWTMGLKNGRSKEIFNIDSIGTKGGFRDSEMSAEREVALTSFLGSTLFPRFSRKPGQEMADVLEASTETPDSFKEKAKAAWNHVYSLMSDYGGLEKEPEIIEPEQADINIFSVASGHLYERFLGIMMASTMKHTNHTVKFWLIENYLSPSFKNSLPVLAAHYNFSYQLVTYKWPHWLRAQTEKQREIWGYKILFLDVLFPLSLDKVIFVDADQIVRTDLYDLVQTDLHGAPYGFTPMCDSRTEIEGFRFWKQGYWKSFLRGMPYHISALYVVDLKRFREIAAGDRLRQQYHQLSADPNSLANLDQDLPNHMQTQLPIHSLDQEWLWCETWCADEELGKARTIDLCNNPMTKEPKLERARRQVPEWTPLDEEVQAVREGRFGRREEGEERAEKVEEGEGKVEGKDEL